MLRAAARGPRRGVRTPSAGTPATIRRTVGIRVHEPGQRGDDEKGTDADAAGLADLFDELAALGFDDALDLVARQDARRARADRARRGSSTSPGADPQPGGHPARTIAVP